MIFQGKFIKKFLFIVRLCTFPKSKSCVKKAFRTLFSISLAITSLSILFRSGSLTSSRLLKALLISDQNHQLVTTAPETQSLPNYSVRLRNCIFGSKIPHSHPYPFARSQASATLRMIVIPIQLTSFLHLQVPLSTHSLFPPRLFLLYLKLFLVLTDAEDNLSCLLFLCLYSVTEILRCHSFLQLS